MDKKPPPRFSSRGAPPCNKTAETEIPHDPLSSDEIAAASKGTLAHELSHQLGADDHYCYRYDSFSDANDEESEHCANQNCYWCNGTAVLPSCLMTKSSDYPDLTSLYCSACKNTISTYVETYILP